MNARYFFHFLLAPEIGKNPFYFRIAIPTPFIPLYGTPDDRQLAGF